MALIGKPNVGKSSLFNALLESDRAIVTPHPGTTRDTLEEKFLLGDVPLTLTDTAGVLKAEDRGPMLSSDSRRLPELLKSKGME